MANLIPGTNHFTFAQGRKSVTCSGDRYIQNNYYADGIFNGGYRNNGCCGGGMGMGYGMGYGFGGYDMMGGYDFRCFNGGFGMGGGCCGNSFGDKILGWMMGIDLIQNIGNFFGKAGEKEPKTDKTDTTDKPHKTTTKKNDKTSKSHADNSNYTAKTIKNDDGSYYKEYFDNNNKRVKKEIFGDDNSVMRTITYKYDPNNPSNVIEAKAISRDNKLIETTKYDYSELNGKNQITESQFDTDNKKHAEFIYENGTIVSREYFNTNTGSSMFKDFYEFSDDYTIVNRIDSNGNSTVIKYDKQGNEVE